MTPEETAQMAELTARANHAEAQAAYWRESAELARREWRYTEGLLESLQNWLVKTASPELSPARFECSGRTVRLLTPHTVLTHG